MDIMSKNSRTTKSRDLCERLEMGSKKWKAKHKRAKKDWDAHWGMPTVAAPVLPDVSLVPREERPVTITEQEYEGWCAKIRQWKRNQEHAKQKAVAKPAQPGTLPRKVIRRAAEVEYVRRRSGPVRVLTGEERARAIALALVARKASL